LTTLISYFVAVQTDRRCADSSRNTVSAACIAATADCARPAHCYGVGVAAGYGDRVLVVIGAAGGTTRRFGTSVTPAGDDVSVVIGAAGGTTR
jgi:hypothetical protein